MGHNGYMDGAQTIETKGAHTMSAHSTTQLANGHTLTIVEGGPVKYDSLGPRNHYSVQERNELGTFICTAFSCHSLEAASAWVARAVERGYGLRPTIGNTPTPSSARSSDAPNPVALVLYFHGWTIQQRRNGMWDAVQQVGVGVSPGFNRFSGVMDYLLAGPLRSTKVGR